MYKYTNSYTTSCTRRAQSKLATYCRTGVYDSIEGVRRENVHHYRRLVFNVVKDCLLKAYPLTNGVLPEETWDNMIHVFWSKHSCQNPQLWQMPRELCYFVRDKYISELNSYPFILDLLWFEWAEIECFTMEDIAPHAAFEEIRLQENEPISLSRPLVINREVKLSHFTYPVFEKKAHLICSEDKGDFYLCTYRLQNKGRDVHFLSISPVFVRMIEILLMAPCSLENSMKRTCEDLGISYSDATLMKANKFVQDASRLGLILGYAA